MKLIFESSITGDHLEISDVLRVSHSSFFSNNSGECVPSYKILTCGGRLYHYPRKEWLIFSVDGR